MGIYDKIFKPKKLVLSDGKVVEEKRTRTPLVLLLLLIATVISVRITGFRSIRFSHAEISFCHIRTDVSAKDGIFKQYLGTAFRYDQDVAARLLHRWGSGNSICHPGIQQSGQNKVVLGVVRIFLSIVRTIPTLVAALIATYIWGLGTMAGTVAIAVFTFAYVGKQLYELIETVDMGAYEAMEAMGAGRAQAFLAAIQPQVLPAYLSVCLFCFEGNVRYAAILGYVGAGGLGLILNEKIGWREYDSVGMILVVLFGTVLVIEALSHYIRKKLT